jgi:hypothetical protein
VSRLFLHFASGKTQMDALTQDYLQAIEEEVAAVDQEIRDLFDTRRKLYETRERLLAEQNLDDESASDA